MIFAFRASREVGKAKRAHGAFAHSAFVHSACAHPMAAIVLLLASPVTAGAQTPACHAGQMPREVAELLFGRKTGDRLGVSEAQWGRFVDGEISARFPAGLTVFDAKGAWRDSDRKTIVHEPSKVVEIVLPGKPDDGEQLNQIAQAYKSRFRQQSVGIVIRGACVSF
jgi:hypothetical protein